MLSTTQPSSRLTGHQDKPTTKPQAGFCSVPSLGLTEPAPARFHSPTRPAFFFLAQRKSGTCKSAKRAFWTTCTAQLLPLLAERSALSTCALVRIGRRGSVMNGSCGAIDVGERGGLRRWVRSRVKSLRFHSKLACCHTSSQ